MDLDPLAHTSFDDDDITEDEIRRLRQIPAGTLPIAQNQRGSTVAEVQHELIENKPSEEAKKAADFGIKFVNDDNGTTAYHTGGGRQDTNPLLGEPPYKLDCASFVYWCYDYAGVSLNGGSNGMSTKTIRIDPKLYKVGGIGSGIKPQSLLYGDIVFFGMTDSHVGIYIGNGEFIGFNGTGYNNYSKGCERQRMDSGYWEKEFKGHVLRYTGKQAQKVNPNNFS